MKKILFFCLLLTIVSFMATGCHSCKSENKGQEEEDTASVATLVVERTVSLDRENMFNLYGGDYQWFESCIVLDEFLDGEGDGSVFEVNNVFQVVTKKEDGYDTKVVFFNHSAVSSDIETHPMAFWLGDQPLNDEVITLTFRQAFNRLMETNIPKPHSRYCVLRKEMGAVPCNPQYIFGNLLEQVYVDAVTGEVSDENPAYKGIERPLGEWP